MRVAFEPRASRLADFSRSIGRKLPAAKFAGGKCDEVSLRGDEVPKLCDQMVHAQSEQRLARRAHDHWHAFLAEFRPGCLIANPGAAPDSSLANLG